MKKSFIGIIVLCTVLVFSLNSCEIVLNQEDGTPEEENETEKLYVKFENEASSTHTITNIRLMHMGVAGDIGEPNGNWGENILTDNQTIAPGEHKFFTLDIPNLHYCYCHIGVDDGNGNEIMLQEQDGVNGGMLPTITHWGSHDRTVGVTIRYDQELNRIYITGYGDSAGIQ